MNKWITDRLPTENDADENGHVVVTTKGRENTPRIGVVGLSRYEWVTTGVPWMARQKGRRKNEMSEWITDRLPTVKDANAWAQVWVTDDYENVYATSFVNLSVGTPWQKIVSPKPYVKPEPERWKPNVNEIYFSIVLPHYVFSDVWLGTSGDHDRYASGNCFQTQAQTHEAASRVRELLLNYHEELNNE